jgi:hypothetical protein
MEADFWLFIRRTVPPENSKTRVPDSERPLNFEEGRRVAE